MDRSLDAGLVERLRDQRITGFNAQTRVREEAADEIARLTALVKKLQEPPPCQHTNLQGWVMSGPDGTKSESWCMGCGKKLENAGGPWVTTLVRP